MPSDRRYSPARRRRESPYDRRRDRRKRSTSRDRRRSPSRERRRSPSRDRRHRSSREQTRSYDEHEHHRAHSDSKPSPLPEDASRHAPGPADSSSASVAAAALEKVEEKTPQIPLSAEEEKKRARKERLAQWKAQMEAEKKAQEQKKQVEATAESTQSQLIQPAVPALPKSTGPTQGTSVKSSTSKLVPSFPAKFSLKPVGLNKPNGIEKRQIVGFPDEDDEDQQQSASMALRSKIPKIDFNEDLEEMSKDVPQPPVGEEDELEAFMTGVTQEVRQLADEDRKRLDMVQGTTFIDEDGNEHVVAPQNQDEEEAYLDTDDADAIIAAAAKKLASKKKDLPVVDHSKMDYLPFRSDFWIEPPEFANMTKEELELKRAELDNIQIRGKNCPKPVDRWTQFGLPQSVYEVIKRVLKYEKPSPIQAQAIPAIMSGRDVIGIARTGSGKTIAFLLPMFRHIMDQPSLESSDGPIALIMTPTRELALQIHRDCKQFTKVTGLRAVCAYGGAPIKDQIAELKRGAEIVICTPGRLIDLLCANSGRVTNLRRVTYLVLDEADRMFDMGFEPQVMKIVGNIRPERQTVLFSATFPRQMEALARKILKKPLEITVGGRSVVCQDVNQIVEIRVNETKFMRLLEILGQTMAEDPDSKVLVFVDRHESADNILGDLLKRGYPCQSLHGGKDQEDRASTISDFKSGNVNILIATSVAARGLDVKNLKVVVNYECPNHMEDYVHRVGRTGRAGNKGTAITFITPDQEKYAVDIMKALKMSGAEVPEDLEKLASAFISKVKAGGAKYASSGFGGKGLEKLEQERDLMKKIQRKTHGGDLADEEEEQGASDGEATDEIREDSKRRAEKFMDMHFQVKLIESGVDAMDTGDDGKPATSGLKKVKELIAGFQGMSKKNDSAKLAYEIEINDYPQKARWRVTGKDQLRAIIDMSGAAVTTRGLYYPPGKQPELGERKLYLHIEGPDRETIDIAKNEIKRILFDTTVSQLNSEAVAGRYSVV